MLADNNDYNNGNNNNNTSTDFRSCLRIVYESERGDGAQRANSSEINVGGMCHTTL